MTCIVHFHVVPIDTLAILKVLLVGHINLAGLSGCCSRATTGELLAARICLRISFKTQLCENALVSTSHAIWTEFAIQVTVCIVLGMVEAILQTCDLLFQELG